MASKFWLPVRSLGRRPIQTSFESPWQNGVAERWVESCRRDLLDHVIAFNEAHLKRLLAEYVRYYHEDRTHLGLQKRTPGNRPCSTDRGRVIASLDSAVCITVTNAQRKDYDSRLPWNYNYFDFKQSSARSSDSLGERV